MTDIPQLHARLASARGVLTALRAERDRVCGLFDLACVEVSAIEAAVINAEADAPGKPPSPTV
jgi:hypothetical protein